MILCQFLLKKYANGIYLKHGKTRFDQVAQKKWTNPETIGRLSGGEKYNCIQMGKRHARDSQHASLGIKRTGKRNIGARGLGYGNRGQMSAM
jgi:hypothetical protein